MPISKKKLYDRYVARLKPLLSSPLTSDMASAIHNGKTEVLRMSRFESSAFDTSWVDVIEDVLYDLGEIINAPRTVTKEEGSLVPVELAKKTNAESVQHLASHTQYVKNIDEQGNVVPSKIMSFSNDDFLYTYENRFIATFIRRLVLFVEKRYAFVQAYIPLHKEEVMMVKTKAFINDEEVEIETRIKTKRPSLDPSAAKAEAIAARIRAMREYILYYYSSPFMHKMKNERDVRKPILMTNIIRKNLRYHKCFEVFNFIEKYDSLGMHYKSEDRYSALTDEQLSELSLIQLGEYLSVMEDNDYEAVRVKQHSYKPKMRSSLDEEEFLFAPLPKGPIEFVRVDEEFQKYLDTRIYPNLPLHPKRAEAQFYADEYTDKRVSKEDHRQIERLLSRKELAAKRFEKVIQKLIDERTAEEALLHKMEEEERLYAEELLLEKKRAEIRSLASLGEDLPEEEASQEESVEEEAPEKEEETPAEPIAEEPIQTESNDQSEEAVKPVIEESEAPAESSSEEPIEQPEEVVESSPEEAAPEPVAEEAQEEPEEVAEPVAEEQAQASEVLPTEEAPLQEKTKKARKSHAKKKKKLESALEEPKPEEEKPAKTINEETPVEEAVEPVEETKEPEPQEAIEEPVAEPIAEAPIDEVKTEETSEEQKPEESNFEDETVIEPKATPVEEPVEEPKVEEPKEPKAKEEKPTKEKAPRKNKAPLAMPLSRKGKKKPEPKKESKKKPERKKKEKPEPIPGAFVVKCREGYFVKEKTFTKEKSEARIFHDFNLAHECKKKYGGKVVKL